MSKIKEYYHDLICEEMEMRDFDHEYEEWKRSKDRSIESWLEAEADLEIEAEKWAFFRTFEITGCFPM